LGVCRLFLKNLHFSSSLFAWTKIEVMEAPEGPNPPISAEEKKYWHVTFAIIRQTLSYVTNTFGEHLSWTLTSMQSGQSATDRRTIKEESWELVAGPSTFTEEKSQECVAVDSNEHTGA
jgi:hypothetical protein